jgi:hypothetical protein
MRGLALALIFALAACGMPTNEDLKSMKEKLVEWIRAQTTGSTK